MEPSERPAEAVSFKNGSKSTISLLLHSRSNRVKRSLDTDKPGCPSVAQRTDNRHRMRYLSSCGRVLSRDCKLRRLRGPHLRTLERQSTRLRHNKCKSTLRGSTSRTAKN